MDIDNDGGAGNDPFASLQPFCHVSSSQEERLRRCPFAPEPYNPESDESSSSDSSSSDNDIPVESTGIIMVSLPESQGNDNSNSHEVFHTPLEESAGVSSNELRPSSEADGGGGGHRNLEADGGGGGETVAVEAGFSEGIGSGTVDLSRDSELGFVEIELAQRVEPDFDPNRSQLEDSVNNLAEFRVSRSGLPLVDGLGESPLKKLKASERNSESERGSQQSDGSDFTENLEINGGESSAKRKLEFSQNDEATEVVDLENEANDSVLGLGNGERRAENGEINGKERLSAKEFIETMAMLRNDSGRETQERAVENGESPPVRRRRLPNSIMGQPENAAEDKARRELTLLDVLRLISEDCDDRNHNLNCSFLEIAKGRGMTFPRPASWPESGTNFGEDEW